MDQDSERNRRLRQGGFAFFGAVSASLSHEINNVLAIVSELSGLLGDITTGAAQGRPLDPERLSRMSERINGQVERGKRLVKRLNRFAHSVDQPMGAVDLADAMELITTICRRFADLQRATLDTDFPDQSVVVQSSAFGLMQAVHLCFDLCLGDGGDEGRSVTVGFSAADGGGTIRVSSSAPLPENERAAERLEYLDLLMAEIGGSAKICESGFELFAPQQRGSITT